MAQGIKFPVRETAENSRTFTEEEHKAVAASLVAAETAARDEKIAALTAENERLSAELASLTDAKDVAEAAKDAAEKALEDFKAETAREKEVAARRDSRVEEVRKVLPHKPDEFFAERASAWAEKSDEDFSSYVAELQAALEGVEVAKSNDRETASFSGKPAGQSAGGGNTFFKLQRGGA